MGMAALQLDLFQDLELSREEAPEWSDDDLLDLCESLIVRSVQDLLHPRGRGKGQFLEHLDWIGTDAKHPFTFRFCCEVCGYDADRMREAIADRILKRNLVSVRDLENLGWL